MSWHSTGRTTPHQYVSDSGARGRLLRHYVQETGPFDKELIALLPKSLKFVCHNGAGYDNVDVDALTRKGSSPDIGTFSIVR